MTYCRVCVLYPYMWFLVKRIGNTKFVEMKVLMVLFAFEISLFFVVISKGSPVIKDDISFSVLFVFINSMFCWVLRWDFDLERWDFIFNLKLWILFGYWENWCKNWMRRKWVVLNDENEFWGKKKDRKKEYFNHIYYVE